MFIEEVKEDQNAPEDNHFPPTDWKWGCCDSRSPGVRGWICTRGFGHDGLHRAASDMWTWAAEWDDNRSTDPVDMPTELV